MTRAAPTADQSSVPVKAPSAHAPDADARLRQLAMIVAAIVAAGFIVAYFLLALDWREKPFLGVMVDHTLTVSAARPIGDTPWNGRQAGLRAGDRIQRIGGDLVVGADARNYLDVLAEREPGQTVEIAFNRPVTDGGTVEIYGEETCGAVQDGVALCTVSVALDVFSASDMMGFFVLPLFSSIAVLVLALVMIRMRPYQPVTVLAVGASLALVIYMAGIFDVGSTHTLAPLWLLSVSMLFGMMLTIGLTFPMPVGVIYRIPVLRYAPVAFGLVLGGLLVLTYLSETQTGLRFATQLAGLVTLAGNLILAALLYFYQRPRANDSVTRDQANTIFIGMLLALVPATFWIISLFTRLLTNREIVSFSVEVSMPFLIMPVMGLAYATLRLRHHFDTDRFISRTITFSIMLVALIAGYFFLVLGASLFMTDAFNVTDPLVVSITIFLLAVGFLPVRNHIQRRVERIYFRERRNYADHLEAFSQLLTNFSGQTETIDAFVDALNETIQPETVFVFLRDNETETYIAAGDERSSTDIHFGMDSGVVELIQARRAMIYLDPRTPWPLELRVDRARLQILQTLVIVGLGGQEVDGHYLPNGFALIGPPRSGEKLYKFEELRFIDNLIAQVAVAVERAQVIGNLQRRVQELDVLSQVGQAVSYTVEYDDLLELINAQSFKGLNAKYFYIVLHDPNADQLYYAFFQEGEDRERERENMRWMQGNDLYSEVLTSAQPLRVENYAETMKRKGYRTHFESEDIRSWMGVPLIAGQSTLGVIAVADPSPDRVFTADELRIFTNIGALAATSLDKARLFAETNQRARQLGALNDISRQLVAAEADVEALLEIITSAAVDILNAEAGSLLLNTEDASGDLEFKAVVGDAGQELLGKRLEKGHGLVGKVATTGEAVISNDIAQDNRWQGEVAEETTFKTSSILAVPLVAKNETIGVLEVLNKKDGTVYTDEDSKLLTTFAGQAAIALENARLFQRTDEALGRRLEELEALERIDVELNRTLDLNRISELTVNWAVENSNATAGMLAIVTDEQNELHTVCMMGYPEAALDSDNRNPAWSVEAGMIQRVMRTRSLDLQPDVSIDREYIEVLPGSLSQMTIPMLSGNEIIAILILETDEEPRLSLFEVDRLQRMVDHAAIAIANALFSADLMRANETKSEFMGFAAHELKNPLTSVKGYAATMQNPKMLEKMIEMAGPAQIQNMAAIIQSNAERMQGIIDDLRDIAAIDAGPAKFKIDLEPTSLWNIVNDTLMSFQSQFEERNQTIDNRITEDMPLIMADSKRLIQVMTNFISNAHKYGGYDSTITINGDVIERYRNKKGEIIGDVMQISIVDQGIGLSEEDLSKLFREDYFRSENEKAREQKGTGLGMMITKRIIERHNGEVWVKSELEVGSTFFFVIPLAPRLGGRTTGEFKRVTEENQKIDGESASATQETESAPGSD